MGMIMKQNSIVACVCGCAVALAVTVSGCVIHVGGGHGVRSSGVWANSAQRGENLASALPADGTVEVHNKHGAITVEGVDGDECRVVADIRVNAASQDIADELAAAVRVELQAKGDKLCVVTHVPWLKGSASVAVHLSIEAPRGAALDLATRNHPVDASGVGGAIQIKTHNGSVRVAGDPAAAADDVSLETHNGSIDYAPPTALPGRVEISSHNGAIKLSRAMPVYLEGRIGKGVSGTVIDGAAGAHLRLKTHNGSITVR